LCRAFSVEEGSLRVDVVVLDTVLGLCLDLMVELVIFVLNVGLELSAAMEVNIMLVRVAVSLRVDVMVLNTVLGLCLNLVVKLVESVLNVGLELSATMEVNVMLVGVAVLVMGRLDVLVMVEVRRSVEVGSLLRVVVTRNRKHGLIVHIVMLNTVLRVLLDLVEQLIVLVLDLV